MGRNRDDGPRPVPESAASPNLATCRRRIVPVLFLLRPGLRRITSGKQFIEPVFRAAPSGLDDKTLAFDAQGNRLIGVQPQCVANARGTRTISEPPERFNAVSEVKPRALLTTRTEPPPTWPDILRRSRLVFFGAGIRAPLVYYQCGTWRRGL